MFDDERFMGVALDEARAALEGGEVPVGAVVVRASPEGGAGRVIGRAHNQRERLRDPTAHAEMLAITQAAEAVGSWRLEDCTLYVTLEPCPMCAGAAVQARLARLVYGAADPKAGACHSLYSITNDARLNHQVTVVGGVLSGPCGAVLQEFFKMQRARGKK